MIAGFYEFFLHCVRDLHHAMDEPEPEWAKFVRCVFWRSQLSDLTLLLSCVFFLLRLVPDLFGRSVGCAAGGWCWTTGSPDSGEARQLDKHVFTAMLRRPLARTYVATLGLIDLSG